jgi:DNA-binding response OmpR family regulator
MVDQPRFPSGFVIPVDTPARGIDLDLIYAQANHPRVLIIDDDADTVVLLKEILSSVGFDVTGAFGCKEAVKKCTDLSPKIILLDLMIPEIDGWQIFAYLRKITSAPVIIISAKTGKEDIVQGLRFGADDYITKPFYYPELVERVKTVLQRVKTVETNRGLVFPDLDLVIDPESQQVCLRDEQVRLTPREYAVLIILATQASKPVTLKAIGLEIWGADTPETRGRIKYLIYSLRKKMEQVPKRPNIITKGGVAGYCLNTRFA